MSYTSLIPSVTISVQNLYDLLDTYFESPVLEKVKDEKDVSVYMCKIATLLAGLEQRYLVVTTEQDRHPIGTKFELSNISWKTFQTRTIPQNIPVPKHSYAPKSDPIFMTSVTLKKRYETHTDYDITGYPGCMITLLHKNKNLYEYPEHGSIATAIETYKTLFIIL